LEGDTLTAETKKQIETDIQKDFDDALIGIKQLPKSSRYGVYLAYQYYRALFEKIKALPAEKILQKRVRINNGRKIGIMVRSYFLINFRAA
jgi:phytoene/squalene synthetase